MKSHTKTSSILAGAILLGAASCGSVKQTATDTPDIQGKWQIENIVFSDTDYLRPAEAVPGSDQFIRFEADTYLIHTNCNTISGSYTLQGDSIFLGDGPMTERACDNMATEDALRRILPDIATLYLQNDTVLRLNARTPSSYILLKRQPAATE